MLHSAHGYWLEEAGAVAPAPPLAGEREADVVVVGGGFTGLWAAWHAKRLEPEARVILLEADEHCGRGPSGRNGGFCNVMWFSLPSMSRRWGAGPALAVARAAEASVREIGEFCEAEGVDAWFRMGGYLQVSTAAAHDQAWTAALAACEELGVGDSVRALTPEQVAERCASPEFRAGAFYPTAATVQPARLALGLRERLRERGVEIFESTPVRSLRDDGGGVEALTPGGSVRTGAAVLAIGAAAKSWHGPLRRALTVASSHIVLTEPVPDVIAEAGWSGGECITDSRALIDYFRTTPDGRIAFGWGGGRIAMGARLGGRSEVDAEVVATTAEHLHACFPALRGRRITHAWGGPIDASPTHLPMVVPLAGGPRLRRRRLHRQRRRPLADGRPHPRLARPRPPRRALAPRLRRPRPAAGPARALPLDRRRGDPPRDHGQRGGRASGSPPRPSRLSYSQDPGVDRLPHRPMSVAAVLCDA